MCKHEDKREVDGQIRNKSEPVLFNGFLGKKRELASGSEGKQIPKGKETHAPLEMIGGGVEPKSGGSNRQFSGSNSHRGFFSCMWKE